MGLDLSLDFVSLGWVRSVIRLVSMIPISISGLGVREATFVYLLKAYAILPEKAIALSLLVFAQRLVHAFIGGWFEFERHVFRAREREALMRD